MYVEYKMMMMMVIDDDNNNNNNSDNNIYNLSSYNEHTGSIDLL